MTRPIRGEAALRQALVAALKRLDDRGLIRGNTGNLSARCGQGMLITPTGMGADDIAAADLVWVGDDGEARGRWQPSSEWLFHRAAYRERADLAAIVHAHSIHATALACLERPLPAFHYMVAIAGGVDVPCVPYHLFGTDELSAAVAAALRERDACLLGHHGQVAGGTSIERAMKVAFEVEALAEIYLKALSVAEPATLSAAQMDEVIAKFRSYGKAARR